jgi:hypothetical protein
MQNKQTAVSYVLEKLQEEFPEQFKDMYDSNQFLIEDIFLKAKQIEKDKEQAKKEHIKNAYFSGWLNGDVREYLVSDLSEEYYNKIYKQQDND